MNEIEVSVRLQASLIKSSRMSIMTGTVALSGAHTILGLSKHGGDHG